MLEQILNFLQPFHYWLVAVIIICIYAMIRFLKMLDEAQEFGQCPRCGWEIPYDHIYKDHCFHCKHLSDEYLNKLYGENSNIVRKTGYNPKNDKS